MLPENVYEARKLLLRNWPMYGMAVMGAGDPVFSLSMPTACTDGVKVFLNPAFIHRMPVPHLAAVLGHEGTHILRADPDHMARLVWPDGTPILKAQLCKLNQAMDQWINLAMEDEGFQFPPNLPICHDRRFKGMSVRQIYDLLPDPPPPDDPEDGEGQGGEGEGDADDDGEGTTEKDRKGKSKGKPGDGDPSGKKGIGQGDDVMSRPLTPEEAVEHRIQVRQAYEAAKAQGKVPGWAEQFVQKLSRPRITFKDFFEPWLHDSLDKDDASYRRLNRHYLPDWFAPTILGNNFGNFVIALDTSGSCWGLSHRLLSIFNAALVQLRPVTTTLLQFDAAIQGPPILFKPGETVESGPPIKIVGGGGTSFVPIFEHVHRKMGDQIDGLIVLTDLYGDFPSRRPPYPVLWVTISDETKAPFGRCCPLKPTDDDD